MRPVNFRGEEVAVSAERIRPESRYGHYHYYEIRHSDNARMTPCAIEENVVVNFRGTIRTTKPLELVDGCLVLDTKERSSFARFLNNA